jgi:hypothetical protein
LGAAAEVQEMVADSLEADHELHASQKFASLGGLHFRDGAGHSIVDFEV